MQDLDKIIREMKTLGEFLVDFSFPKVKTEEEEQISILKSREINVDGFEVVIHYGKSVHDQKGLECFQCLGVRNPFLPFNIVVKLAKRFLGEKHLCFVDVFASNKKVYCWTLNTDMNGKPLPPEQEVIKKMDFEGFEFNMLNPAGVNFY
jgi:hypothetical protein